MRCATLVLTVAGSLLLAAGGVVRAAPPASDVPEKKDDTGKKAGAGDGADAPLTDQKISPQSFLTFKHSGYFRLRGDLFVNGDLGNKTSGLQSPIHLLGTNTKYGHDNDTITTANIRFRWRPELWIGERLSVGIELDVLDNLVLGSNSDSAAGRFDNPIPFFSDSAPPPGSGDLLQDSIHIKQVWGQWEVMHAFLLKVGRMADHFGLGMVYNNGECLDCDFGDISDRAAITVRLFGFESTWFIDMPGEGLNTANRFEHFGQPRDGTQEDDVTRWGFTVGMIPYDRALKEKRRRDLLARKPVVDWFVRNTFVTQHLHSDVPLDTLACPAAHPLDTPYDCQALRPRKADLWLPQAWLKLMWWPRHDMRFRMELEFAGLIGDVQYTQNIPSPSSAKDFLAFGGVLQFELQWRKLTALLETGFATGDEIAFGPYGNGFHEPDDTAYGGNLEKRGNKSIGEFLFDRDYHVDLLLYRQAIGTVTNSWYIKPTLRYELLQADAHVLGGELSFLYGHALVPESTPGGEAPLGFETDLRFFYEMGKVARADLEMGMLVPLKGFFNRLTRVEPETAFTLQLRLTARF